MKLQLISLTLIFCFFSLQSFGANEKINVVVIDEVVNIANEHLEKSIDRKLLGQIIFSTEEAQLSPDMIQTKNVSLLDYILELLQNPDAGNHGNHVSEVLLNGLPPSKVNLIPIPSALPISEDSRFYQLNNGSRSLLASLLMTEDFKKLLREFINQLWQNYSRIIKENNVKVVNISFGPKVKRSFWDKLSFSKFFRTTLRKEFKKMAQENPQTLFIIAAGNEGVEIKNNKGLLAADLPNVLTVGALDFNHAKKANWTNFSDKYVDVLTPGYFFSQITRTSNMGTSYGAPHVANRVLELLIEGSISSNVTGAQLKQAFLNSSTLSKVTLGSKKQQVYLSYSHQNSYTDLNVNQLSSQKKLHENPRFFEVPYNLNWLDQTLPRDATTEDKEGILIEHINNYLKKSRLEEIAQSSEVWNKDGLIVALWAHTSNQESRYAMLESYYNSRENYLVLIRDGKVYALNPKSKFLQEHVANIFKLESVDAIDLEIPIMNCDKSFNDLILVSNN